MDDKGKSKAHLLEELQALRRQAEQWEEQNSRYGAMKKALRDMGNRVYRLQKAIETTGVGITITDPDGTIIYTNPADASMHGYSVEELLGLPSNIFAAPDGREEREKRVARREAFERWERERLNMRKDGTLFPVKLNSSPIYDTEKYYIGDVTVCENITERKRSEEELDKYREHLEELIEGRTSELKGAMLAAQQLNAQLQQEIAERKVAEERIRLSLQDKEVLLREIHHRVKNNLQIITSLLSLQANRLEDGHSQEMFQESERRIQAMALIHEKLYETETLSRIDFSEYVTTIARELYAAYHSSSGEIRLQVKVEDVNLTVSTAIPCGLIINELVSNALKYAFPARNGSIRVTMSRQTEEFYELRVSDDGVGMPPEFRLDGADSLGLQLVKGLVEDQLDGSLSFHNSSGTTWSIRFPI